MPRILYADPFIDELSQVTSARVINAIFDAIDLLPTIPSMGSKKLPQAIVDKYGSAVRKLVVKPFLVIYKELESGDILVLGLMYGRAAY